MDRSFLSQPEVIAASRQFLCIRLATYEDKDEAAYLRSFLVSRSGDLENTVFCILSPDGQKRLVRAGRGTRNAFADASQMAEGMQRIAQDYPAQAAPAALPKVANVRLALDVAAADSQPLIVLYAKDEAAKAKLEERMALLAWSDAFLGRFIYSSCTDTTELKAISGVDGNSGILVIEPDKFGLKGKVISQVSADAPAVLVTAALNAGLSTHAVQARTMQNHVREGRELGIFWETKIPVTDVMEKAARERGRRITPKEKEE